MANEINKIQLNTNYQLNNVGDKHEEKAKQKEENKAPVEQKQVSAEDTLKFMNAQAISARPDVEKPRVLNISKYVTPEQAQRICGFISQFENAVADGLKSIESELGNALSEDAKMNLAIELFKVKNM